MQSRLPHQAWYQRGVLYQVDVPRFADADGDGYGDLRGLIDQLDYLNDGGKGTEDSLGIESVWLSGIFEGDYREIDPRVGTMADVDEVVRQAHDRGMKLLLDWPQGSLSLAGLEGLRFWLHRGMDGFQAEPEAAWGRESAGSLCEVLAEGLEGFELDELYLSLPGARSAYAPCRLHPAVHNPVRFNLVGLAWSAAGYRELVDQYEAMLGSDDWPQYVWGVRDSSRLVGQGMLERARLLSLLQLTLRGLPVVYQGQEWGGSNVLALGGLRGSQEGQPDSSWQLYRHLVHLRQVSEALAEGSYRSIETANPCVYGFGREAGHSKCYILLNFSDNSQTVSLGEIGAWIAGTHLVEGDGIWHEGGRIELEPYEGRLYEVRRKVT